MVPCGLQIVVLACTQFSERGLVPSLGSDLKNRRAETAYLAALRALKLLEGESNLRLQERSY